MRISPNSTSVTNKTPVTKTVKKENNFAAITAGKSSQARALLAQAPISQNELQSLARDIQSGVLTPSQANQRFVATVVNNSLKTNLGEREQKKMLDTIEQFCSDDPEFVNNLVSSLSKIS